MSYGDLIDEMQLTVSPVILGRGEALFPDIDLCSLGFKITEHRNTTKVTHIRLKKEP